MENLMRSPVDTPASRIASAGTATAALGSISARQAGLTMMLFRDDQDGSDTLAEILSEVMCGLGNRYPSIQVDVRDHPALAAYYNVQTTPTILLVKDGAVVDRVIGTPTRILLQSLLDARTPVDPSWLNR
jgi:thioredoxin-like negative regulator of GroEL